MSRDPATDAHGAQPSKEWFEGARLAQHRIDNNWKHIGLKLRVARRGREYYIAPYDFHAFAHRFEQLKVGPFNTLEDAQLAAEMLGEIGGEGYEYIEFRG